MGVAAGWSRGSRRSSANVRASGRRAARRREGEARVAAVDHEEVEGRARTCERAASERLGGGRARRGWRRGITGELVALLTREERAKREQRLARRQDARGKVERGERVFHCLFVIATHDAAYNTSWIFSELDDASPCDLNDHAVVCKGFRGVSCGVSVSNTGDEP